jgi:hypothetical protein
LSAPVRLLGIDLIENTSVAAFEVLLRDALVETDTTAADRDSLEAIGSDSPQGQTLARRALESAEHHRP